MSEDLDVQMKVQIDAWDRPRWLRATCDAKTGEKRSYEGTEHTLTGWRRLWARLRKRPTMYVTWSEYPRQLNIEQDDTGYRVSLPNGTTILRKNV